MRKSFNDENKIDMHTRDTRKKGETEQRIYALSVWKESNFFTEKEKVILALTEAVTLMSEKSSFLLSIVLRNLPVGTGYSVWVGIGVIGVVIAGIKLLEVQISTLRIIFLIMIINGIIGLRVVEN